MASEVLSRVRIVLMATSHPGNIGAAARAMKTMGLSQLILVAPRNSIDEKTYAMASNALDVIDHIQTFDTLAEAVAGCQLVAGTSARSRNIQWPLKNPRELAPECIRLLEQQDADVALVFGREDFGLSNEELQQCQVHIHIPTNPDYSSLNLAAAVQLLAYEMRLAALSVLEADIDSKPALAKHDEVELFYQHMEAVLLGVDFIKANNPRQTMTRLRRLFNRVRLESLEVAMLRGILRQIEKVFRQS